MAQALRITASDSVATLLGAAAAGETVEAGDDHVVAAGAVPKGHKIALVDLAARDPVIKFGFPIGHATRSIARGEHVHSHNLSTDLSGTLDYQYRPHPDSTPAPASTAMFQGYRRADGRVGTRNEIWILPTVGCVGRTAERIAKAAGPLVAGQVDGGFAFAPPFGGSQFG